MSAEHRITVDGWTLVNLTPHPITVPLTEGGSTTLEAAPTAARVAYKAGDPASITPWPVVTERSIGVVGLPPAARFTLLVVSRAVAMAQPNRADLLVPTLPVYGADGRVLAARSLARLRPPL